MLYAEIGRCRPEQFSELVTLLDNEFVFGKGRGISLAKRFPSVLCAANLENIYVICAEGRICATAVVKPFLGVTKGETWQGAMIGMVHTKLEHQGKGLASLLLRAIRDDLNSARVDFAVLWTKIPKFYQRLGWFVQDPSIFGQVVAPPLSDGSIIPRSIVANDLEWIEAVRSKWLPERILRSAADYRALPLPASSIDLFMLNESDDLNGYALVGRFEESGYVYEVVGHPSAFACLWRSITQHYSSVFINDRKDSTVSKWLTKEGGVIWKLQNLAMWLPISNSKPNIAGEQWYVPYLDRI